MTIAAVTVGDATNPVEVQTWLDSHPTITNWRVVMSNGIFYIFYE